MRILLITAGSRGDVEPFAALARRATAAGHDVRLAAPDNSGVDLSGLDTASLGVDYSALIESQGVSPWAAMRNLRDVVRPIMRGVIVGAARETREYRPDVLVYHPKVLSAPLAAEALGIPHVLVEIVPSMTPTRAFPAAGTVTASLGPLNRLTYSAAAGAGAMFRGEVAEAAAVMGTAVPRHPSPPALTLMPISPAILPRPADWPASVLLTGAWTTGGATAAVVPGLAEFIAQGPFVYAGFGSMAIGDAADRGRAVIEAVRSRGERVVIATGLGGVAVPEGLRGDDMFATTSVDHASVLPHATAAIHHGGIGTVHAATAAGTVSIVVPFIADQPFWGRELHRAGLAPAPIPQKRLTTDRLSAALAEAPRHQDAVDAAVRRMADEDGTGVALAALEHLR